MPSPSLILHRANSTGRDSGHFINEFISKIITLRSFQFSYKKSPLLFDYCDDMCSCLQKDCFGLDLISNQSVYKSFLSRGYVPDSGDTTEKKTKTLVSGLCSLLGSEMGNLLYCP